MSSYRIAKQSVYAFGFFALVAIVTALLIRLNGQPVKQTASSTPTPEQQFQPATVQETAIISHGNTVDLVAYIVNPNAGAGLPELPVTFEVRSDKGEILASKTESTYLLPGASQYVSILDLPLPRATQVNVTLPATQEFTVLPPRVTLPQLSTFLFEPNTRSSGNRTLVEQKGLITNNSTYDYSKVEMSVIGFDQNDTIASVGKTFVGKLEVGEQREFTVLWQKPQADVAKMIARPSTNIFKEENVLRVMGDPSSLR